MILELGQGNNGRERAKSWFRLIIAQISNRPIIFHFFRRALEDNLRAPIKVIKEELDLTSSRMLLDIGCGTGAFVTSFDPAIYVGVDISKKYVKYARKKFVARFCVVDARLLAFKDSSFDDAVIVGVLHHLSDASVQLVMRETRRVVRAGGTILVMEDIPTLSHANLIGKLIHKFDNGQFIRTQQAYADLLCQYFLLKKQYAMSSGFCDYGVFVLTNKRKDVRSK